MIQTLERKIINTVRRAVAESVQEVLSDPDYELELTRTAQKRLARFRRIKKHSTLSLGEVKQRFS